MSFQSTCPNCGSTVEFRAANSLCVVCEACDSVIGRGGDALQNYGKTAELVQTESPLRVGLKGEYRGTIFEITGRTQWRHAAGGVWDEWYAAFYDGERWGWIAEAQGRQYITFFKLLPTDHKVPPIEELVIEQIIKLPTLGAMKVTESGEATAVAAEGEFPISFQPGAVMRYADFHGAGGKFATLSQDPGAELELFVGKQVTLADLGVEDALEREQDAERTQSVSVSCPQCGGALALHTPAQTERVTCPACMSLLDADQGNLKYLYKLGEVKAKPTIPLGAKGVLRKRESTVIGFLERYVTYDGKIYRWEEYLLYSPRQPFRWLICNQGHWMLGESVSAGDCHFGPGTSGASYKGRSFRLFDISSPKVGAVLGEFYWKVSMGERTRSWDYVRPPQMLSREESVPDEHHFSPEAVSQRANQQGPTTASEVNYTLSEYLEPGEIEKAFGVKVRPPRDVAPNQPYPYHNLVLVTGALLAAVFLAGWLVHAVSPRTKVFEQSYSLDNPPPPTTPPTAEAPDPNRPPPITPAVPVIPPAVPTTASKSFHVSSPFQLRGWRNVAITVKTTNRSQWAHVEGSLYNLKTHKSRPFAAGMPSYDGAQTRYFPAVGAGSYSLNLAFTKQPGTSTQTVVVEVRQGVPRLEPWLFALFAIGFLFVGAILGRQFFEKRRWSESDFG